MLINFMRKGNPLSPYQIVTLYTLNNLTHLFVYSNKAKKSEANNVI